MGKKILPVIIDDGKSLSRDLVTINVAHIYCHTDDTDTYATLSTGLYQYVDKYFITRQDDVVKKLLVDFPGSSIYYIGTPLQRMPIDVEVFANVNEPVLRYIAEGTFYYSMKEIREFNEVRQFGSKFNQYNLNIILTGKIDHTSSMTNLRKTVSTIRNNRLIQNRYILSNVRVIYCGPKNDFLTKYIRVDRAIELKMPTSRRRELEIVEKADNMDLYNMIDRSIYFYHWRALYQVAEEVYDVDPHFESHTVKDLVREQIEQDVQSEIDAETSAESNAETDADTVATTDTNFSKSNDGLVLPFQGDRTITVVLDMSRLDKQVKLIDMSDEIYRIIYRLEESDYQYDTIFMHSDIAAVGSCRVMNYYMSLYGMYGMYQFKAHLKNFTNDGIYTHDEYTALSPKFGLRSDAQLFEHIHFYTNLIITQVGPIGKDSRINRKQKHLILVTYYGIYDQFTYIAQSLERLGYIVHDYPYRKYAEDGPTKLMIEMKKLIDDFSPDYTLWWTIAIDVAVLHNIAQMDRRVKQLYFNWDEPYNWGLVEAHTKAKYLSSAFVTCRETVGNYNKAGTLHAYTLYPGYVPEIHYPMWLGPNGSDLGPDSIEYEFDISFICTNLYENPEEYPDQIVNRKELIETIYDNQEKFGYKFAIFGPEKFKERFPNSYQYFIPYSETGQMFNKSKINICTHVVGDKEGYLNERIFLIMASGGLLMVDPVPNEILVNGKNCVFIDQKRILTQIKSILTNYDRYHSVKKKGYKIAKNYTWDDWAMQMQETLNRDYAII